MESIEEIWESLQNDNEVKMNIEDFEKWLDNIPEEQYHYLDGVTPETNNEIKTKICSKYPDNDKLISSLNMYRYASNIQELRLGGYIRWLTKIKDNWKLLNGGILIKINFTKKGTYIVCKNNTKIMQYNYDNYYTFQKITAEEWLFMMANNKVQ